MIISSINNCRDMVKHGIKYCLFGLNFQVDLNNQKLEPVSGIEEGKDSKAGSRNNARAIICDIQDLLSGKICWELF